MTKISGEAKLNIQNNKINYFGIFLASSLFISSTLVFPLSAYASIVPMDASAGITNSQQMIEMLRSKFKFDLPSDNPFAAGIQAQLESKLADALGSLGGLGGQLDQAANIINLGQSLNKGNFASVIPQILALNNDFKGITNLPDMSNVSSLIQSLAGTGQFQGLAESLPIINKVTENLNNLGNVVSGLNTKLAGVPASVGKAQGLLQTAASRTTAANIVGGNFNPTTGLNADGFTAAEQAQWDAYDAEAADRLSSLNDVNSALGDAATAGDVSDVSSHFTDPGASGAKNTVCEPNSAATKGTGNGNGVPTIEQDGALLDYTGQLVSFTAKIKSINQETCKLVEQLYKKEYELDPKAREEARQLLEEERKKNETMMKEGRVQEGTTEKGPFAPVLTDYVNMKTKSAIYRLADTVKNSESPIKDQMVESLANEAEKDKSANLKNLLKPVEIKGDDPWSRLMSQSFPQNTVEGVSALIGIQKERAVSEAQDQAKTMYTAGSGILPNETCTKWINGVDGNPWCDTWEMVTPAVIIARLAEELNSTYIRQAENVQEAKQEKTTEQVKKAVEETSSYTTGAAAANSTQNNTNGGGTTGGNTSNGNSGNGSTGGDSINPLDIINGAGNGTNGNEQTPPTNEPITIPDLPLPKFDFAQTPASPVNNVGITKLTWSPTPIDVVTKSCVAKNNWIAYGTSAVATTTSIILKAGGSDIGTDSSAVIYSPSAFSFSAVISPNNRALPFAIPQTATMSMVKNTANGGFTQTLTYEPNIVGLIANDIVYIKINNGLAEEPLIAISFTDGMTKGELVRAIIAAMSRSDYSSAVNKIYSGITKQMSSDGTTLILTKSEKDVLATADYEISCKNLTGGERTEKQTITFFK